MNPKAIESTKELNCDLSSHPSKSLRVIPEGSYGYVVSMGCGDACPWVPAKEHIDRDIPGRKNMGTEDFRKARDLIEGKVKQLLKMIQ